MEKAIIVETDRIKGNILDVIGLGEHGISPPFPKPQMITEGEYFKTFIWYDIAYDETQKRFPIFYKARLYKGGLEGSFQYEKGCIFAVGIRTNEYLFLLKREPNVDGYSWVAEKKPISDKYIMNWITKDSTGGFRNAGVGL